jgi:hypothetical protein
MPIRISPFSLIVAALALPAVAPAANLDGSSPAVGNEEAVRLYAEANDFVSNMAEKDYSYDYLQFYWKRAQGNIDRIRLVYPDSPTAAALAKGDLKLGTYPLDYFKTRVLYNLELKRLGAYDDVNCAIFLYGRDETRSDSRRNEALSNILEVLARRQRWEEALRFPVLAAHRPMALHSIFKVAAFYDVKDMIKKMTAQTTPAERKAAEFDPLLAEAMALQGVPRADLYTFVDEHPDAAVRRAALSGVIEREILIHRMETLHVSFASSIQTIHVVVQHPALRDAVVSVAPRLFGGSVDDAAPQLSIYFASRGKAPAPSDMPEAHLAYLQYLADAGRMGDVATYVRDNGLGGETRRACDLKVIEIYAAAGENSEAEAARKAFAPEFSPGADEAALAEFRGRLASTEAPFEARKNSFADLPITDPCVMAVAIMEWSLAPNRSQRGATPWDAVVARFAGGFDNLPKPKSAIVGDAASTLKPY